MGITGLTQILLSARTSMAAKPSGGTDKASPSSALKLPSVNDSVILTSKVTDMLRDVNQAIKKHKDLKMQIKLLEGMKYAGIVIGVAGLVVAAVSSVLLGALILLVGAAAAVMACRKQPEIRYADVEVQMALAETIRQASPSEKKLFIGIVKDKDLQLGNTIDMLTK